MTRSLLSLAALTLSLALAPRAHAQGGGPPPGGMRGPGRMMEMLMRDITLDDSQKAKVAEIQEKFAKEMPAFTPGEPPTPEAMEQRRALMEKQQAEIRAVLTTEQQGVFDRNREALRARMGRRGPPGAP